MATNRDEFTGSGSLNAGGHTPDEGNGWVDQGFSPIGLDGSGNATTIAFNNFSALDADTSNDGTLTVEMQQGAAGGGTCVVWWRSAGFFSGGYRLNLYTGTSGVELFKLNTSIGTYTTGFTSGAVNTIVIVISGNNHQITVNGSLAFNYTDSSSPYTSGRYGLEGVGGTVGDAKWGRIQWDAFIPTYPKDDNQDPQRILERMTRKFRHFR